MYGNCYFCFDLGNFFFLFLFYGIYIEVIEVFFVFRFVKRCRVVFLEFKVEFEMILILMIMII